MNYNTVYVGMDVHKESFTLCAFTIEEDKGKYHQRTDPNYQKVLKHLEYLRSIHNYSPIHIPTEKDEQTKSQ